MVRMKSLTHRGGLLEKEVAMDMGYQIELEGALNESWSDWLIGMDIRHTQGSDGKPRTTLTGVIKDQAMLRGILDRLFNLGLALVSLQRISLESKE